MTLTTLIISKGLVLYLDAGNPVSYPGTGSTWTDIIQSKKFTLFNSPTYDSGNGGNIYFDPASSQYAASSTSLTSSLNTWTVETWHYYTGTNSDGSPCIVTEFWPNATSNLNYMLGNASDSSPYLQTGFYNGNWRYTVSGYLLNPNNWYHIIGTYDGTTIKLYVNNTLIDSIEYSGIAQTGTNGIILMRRWDAFSQFWGGRLGVVRMYNKAISAIEIDQNYNVEKSRFGL